MVPTVTPLLSLLSNTSVPSVLSVLAISMPSFVTPDRLRWIIPLLTLAMIFAALWVVRFITKLVIKASILGVIAIFVLTLWVQRADLGDCAQTCECSLYGLDVEITQEQFVEHGCRE